MRLAAGLVFGCLGAFAAEPLTVGNVLAKSCLSCHGRAAMSGLDMRTPEGVLKGGSHGPAIVPGNAEQSRLYRLVAGLDKPHMPPNGALPPAEVAAIKDWINAGAKNLVIEKAAEQKYWAFVAPKAKPVPGNVIDAFLKSGAAADKRVLVRRAYLDLTGLPPTPAQAAAFVDDASPNAWPKLIDQLLATPQYGERWARHWLDLVRYADSGGYEYDRDRPHAWRYRDYVVNAMNADKPYDKFILEQIAGDELWPGSHEATVATGYLRHGLEANIKTEETRMDELDDLVSTTSGAMLGMTAGCARCHDHKFDPIPQKDYKGMQAIFWNTKYREAPLADEAAIAANKAANKLVDDEQEPVKKQRLEILKRYREALKAKKVAALPAYMKAVLEIPEAQRTAGQKLTAQQIEKTSNFDENDVLATINAADKALLKSLDDQLAALDKKRPAPLATAMTVDNTGPAAPHGVGLLTAATWRDVSFNGPEKPRTVLAKWIASNENPLTARVLVNRVFLNHFGYGLVDTPSNFGKSGSGVTQQELLDTLAVKFMAQGWSLKALHREMMLSNAYRGQTRPRRLEAEAIRDSILAVAGTLNMQMGGPSVQPYIDPTLYQGSSGRTWNGKAEDDPSTWRRSLYVFTKRSIPVPMLDVFDKPDGIGACARRNRSTTSIQSLIMMNSGFMDLQTRKLADRLQADAGSDPGRQVDRAYALALGRAPQPRERALAVDFIQSSNRGLVDFCYTLFNLNEFAYIP